MLAWPSWSLTHRRSAPASSIQVAYTAGPTRPPSSNSSWESSPSKKARKRDLQWFRQGEARTLLAACQALKPRWVAFLMVCFGGGVRWGETTALLGQDIDWARERVHVARTWSEGGGRIEPCKDGEDRWVKLPAATMAALRAHLEAKDLEGSVKGWPPAARQLVFPNTVGRITRYGAFLDLVWQPLLAAAKLPYRKPHAMRHS